MRVTIAKRVWLLLAGAASVAVVATLLMRYVPSQSTSTRGGEPRHANRAAAALATETKEVAVARPEEIPADARRLLDEENLFLAFERARSSTRPDAWWIARQIVDQCNMFTSDSQERNEIDRTVGELNSTNTMAPDRVEQLRRTEKRRAALEEVEKRCNGFRGLGRPWAVRTMRSLETQVKESGGVIGSLLRATELVESGGGSYPAWIQAISAAIGSGNRVAGEFAIRAMGLSLFEARLPPDERPQHAALAALTDAWLQVGGESWQSRGELERLAFCATHALCEDKDWKADGPLATDAKLRAEYDYLVGQYAEGLRRNDPEFIFKVEPKR